MHIMKKITEKISAKKREKKTEKGQAIIEKNFSQESIRKMYAINGVEIDNIRVCIRYTYAQVIKIVVYTSEEEEKEGVDFPGELFLISCHFNNEFGASLERFYNHNNETIGKHIGKDMIRKLSCVLKKIGITTLTIYVKPDFDYEIVDETRSSLEDFYLKSFNEYYPKLTIKIYS